MGGLGTDLYALQRQIKAAGLTSVTGRLYADDDVFDRLRGVADSGYATSPYIGPLSGLSLNSGYSTADAGSFATDPALIAASKLRSSLNSTGVPIKRAGRTRQTPLRTREEVAVVKSPPIDALVNNTDVYSNNFFAEMLIKLLGAEFGGGGTTAAGAAVVEEFAHSRGTGIHSVDGSGLTRGNRASPRQVVRLLQAMRTAPVGDDFIDDLALTGREGTVAERMHGSAADGRCRVKTGTLTGVSNLSGYCFNASGREMIFSVLMGSVGSLDSAHYEQDRIAAAVAASRAAPRQRPQAGFVEDLGPEFLRLGELRARVVAGDHVVGLLRDRVDDLAAGGLDQRRRLLAGEVRRGFRSGPGSSLRAAALARRSEGSSSSRRPFSRSFSISSQVASSASDSAIWTRHDRPDALDLLDLLGIGGVEGVDRAEVVGQRLGRHVADAGQPEGVEDALEGPAARGVDRREEVAGRDLAEALEPDEVLLVES